MAKQSGLGDQLYGSGRNLSGDVGSISSISGGKTLLDMTGIDKSAMERIGGQRTGSIEFNAFFNDEGGGTQNYLGALSTVDRTFCYFRGTTIGNAAAGMVAKQVNYDPTRGPDGSLTFTTQMTSNEFGLEWGRMLTAGVYTSTGTESVGTSVDTGASADFGAQAYLQVFSLTGTDATFLVQDSADNSTFATASTLTFATVSSAPSAQRIATVNTATIRRYIRARVVSSPTGFSSVSWAMMIVKNETAGIVF